MLQVSSIRFTGRPSTDSQNMTVIFSTHCDSNDYHIESNGDDRCELVDRRSVLSLIYVIGGITMFITTSDPLFEQTRVINVQSSAMEYKIAASITTRSILVVVIFRVRLLVTLRSMIQTRYASNPEQI